MLPFGCSHSSPMAFSSVVSVNHPLDLIPLDFFHNSLIYAFPLGGRWHGEAVTDEGAIIERFFVGPDALIGPLDASFRRGVSPPAGGEFLSQRWERNQWPRPPSLAPSGQFTLRIAGDAADGLRLRFAPPRSIGPLSPDPIYGGYPLKWAEHFRRAKSEWPSAIQSGPLGPGFAKIAAGAIPFVRLALPSQRCWCKSWREAQGPPLHRPGRPSYTPVGEGLAPPAVLWHGPLFPVGAAPCGRPPPTRPRSL